MLQFIFLFLHTVHVLLYKNTLLILEFQFCTQKLLFFLLLLLYGYN